MNKVTEKHQGCPGGGGGGGGQCILGCCLSEANGGRRQETGGSVDVQWMPACGPDDVGTHKPGVSPCSLALGPQLCPARGRHRCPHTWLERRCVRGTCVCTAHLPAAIPLPASSHSPRADSRKHRNAHPSEPTARGELPADAFLAWLPVPVPVPGCLCPCLRYGMDARLGAMVVADCVVRGACTVCRGARQTAPRSLCPPSLRTQQAAVRWRGWGSMGPGGSGGALP